MIFGETRVEVLEMKINPCMSCNGHCCLSPIHLYYAKSKRRIYKNAPFLRKRSFFHKIGRGVVCDRYDKENGRCGDYENRPYVCRSFMCNEGKNWIEILESGNDYY